MYLTRLLLDARSARVRRDLGSPYEMHRTLVRAFVQDENQTPPRFLWRLEPQMLWSSPPVVLVQSEHEADWRNADSFSGYFKAAPETRPLLLDRLCPEAADGAPGPRLRFRLFANPTVSHSASERKRGRRTGVVGADAQLAWLERQGQRCGFVLEAAVVTGSDVLHFRKSREDTAPISLQRVCYEGVLRATDAARLKAAVSAGIGPGKAFGCGLLSLARI